MKKIDIFSIFCLGLTTGILMLWIRPYTGYMDADYYYATAREIYGGNGFIQNFLWNYLDHPKGLPHPSFTYWMPLSSLIAAFGLWMVQEDSLLAARLPFVLIYSLVPVGTAVVAFRMTSDRTIGWIAGLLGVFSGFYIRFSTEPDSFGITMILGTGIILLVSTKKNGYKRLFIPLLTGISCGLIHLARADGIVWMVLSAVGLIYSLTSQRLEKSQYNFLKSNISLLSITLVLLGAGYFLIMFPWYLRNISLFNSIFPPGNFRALFLIEYDQLFAFPPESINSVTWVTNGLGNIIRNIVSSVGSNLLSAIIVQGNIVMLPLALLAMIKEEKSSITKMTVLAWIVIFLIMSLIFPFAGKRGGYLHSAAALQPLIWIFSAKGLRIAISHGVVIRNWNPISAKRVFNIFMVVTAVLITIYVNGDDYIKARNVGYINGWQYYQTVDRFITTYTSNKPYRVMINNPAAYNVATGRQAIVIPYGNSATLSQAAKYYSIDFLAIDKNHIIALQDLYYTPETTVNLQYLGSEMDIKIYRFLTNE